MPCLFVFVFLNFVIYVFPLLHVLFFSSSFFPFLSFSVVFVLLVAVVCCRLLLLLLLSYLGSGSTVICTPQYQKIQLCTPASAPAAVVNGESCHQYHILPPPPPPPNHHQTHQPLFTSFGYSRSQSISGELPSGQGTGP